MNKHTPGPWRVDEVGIIWTTDRDYISFDSLGETCSMGWPDSQLVAAAPEMLAALKAVVSVADRSTKEFDAARAAIAKAEGRS